MENATSRNKNSLLKKWKGKVAKTSIGSNGDVITQIPSKISKPLSYEQKRLWFLQQLHPDNPFYNYSELYKLKGQLDVDLLEQSIRLIEDKHDVFKSSFDINNGKPTVLINSDIKFEFKYFDYSNLDILSATEKAKKTFLEISRTAFKLSEGNLLRSILVKISDENYLFLVVIHHIIIDHWSMIIFRKELADNYAKLISKEKVVVTKPLIQYDSYAYWQQNRNLNQKHIDYWKEKLGGDLGVLNFPTDFSKKAIPSYKGALHTKKYSQTDANTFFDLSKQFETTNYIVMLSVFYVLLYKYTQQEDILIGTSITKRNHKSLEKLIGFFNDTLVFRASISKNLSFEEVVTVVKKTAMEAFAHSDVSYDSLVNEINPNRSLSTNPFFQVMFLYNSNKKIDDFGSNIDISHEPFDSKVSKFDLTLHVFENNTTLKSIIDYETDLFEEKTIDRIHNHFEILLQKVLKNPKVILDDISLETKQEEDYFFKLQNVNSSLANNQLGIHDIIEQQITDNKTETAVTFKNEKITYQQLGEKANTIALHLLNKGVKKNDIVGLSLERSSEMIVALLGILKTGAAYLPLDPEYPENRTNYIIENSNTKFVITSSKLKTNFVNSKIGVFSIESIFSLGLKTNKIAFPKVTSSDLAYIIYTSGSTGKPKGVPITHGNIINSTLSRTAFYQNNPSSYLLMSSISFDSSKAGIFWSLCTGANLVVSENRLEQDIERLVETIKKNKISHTLMLPSLYNAILNSANTIDLKSLNNIIVAGEKCNTQLVIQHYNKLPDTNLYNEYGPTEGTVWCIAHKIIEADSQKENIPIGVPVANTEIYILDQNKKRVPFGVPGELYIGGLSLSNGYLNNNIKTAEVFVDNPFAVQQKIYKTGDVVKIKNDNTIEFLGRKDQQIKIRGYRVEIDEIENVIKNNSTVSQAIVIAESLKQTIDLNDLVNQNTEQLLQSIKNFTTVNEIQNLLATVELLNEDEVSVLSENLKI